MIERSFKREIHCPVCGKHLIDAGNGSDIEMICEKCKSRIIIMIKDGSIVTMEDRRGKKGDRSPAVSVSTQRHPKSVSRAS